MVIEPSSPETSILSEEIDVDTLSETEDDHVTEQKKVNQEIPGCSRFIPLQEVRLFKSKRPEYHRGVSPMKIKLQKTRRNCCPYCLKLETNFSRHLVKYHKQEDEVKTYLSIQDENLKVRKRKRTALTEELRKKGNHMYNLKIVNKELNGELLPMRRPANSKYKVTTQTHVACTYCCGLFKKENLYLHVRDCPKLPHHETDENEEKKKKRVTKSAAMMLVPDNVVEIATEALKENVFTTMQGPLAIVAQSDPLIVEFGARYYNTHRDANQINYTSQRMRDLARVYEAMKERNEEINSFEDCFHPKQFNFLMDVVRSLGEFDEDTGLMGVPSIAPRLCSHLKSCADIIKSKVIKDSKQLTPEKNPKIHKIDQFLHLMNTDWNTEVGGNAEKTRKKVSAEKTNILHDDEDIRLMSEKISLAYPDLIKKLKESPSIETYDEVAKLLICHIIILCRRRPAEVAKATLEQYKKIEQNKSLTNKYSSILSEEQRTTERLLSIFNVIGKNSKTVPILLTPDMKEAADCLVASRPKLKIESNLLFARPDSKLIYNGTSIMTEMKRKMNLKNPDHFTATGLRHHAATSTQLQERDDTFTENLATFMGHDLIIHKKNYRLPLPIIQKAQVGHRLLQMTLPTPQISSEHHTLTEVPSTSKQTIHEDHHFSEEEWEPPSVKNVKVTRRRWTEEEKYAVYLHFARHINRNTPPERKEIVDLFQKETALNNRTIEQVCTYVNNIFTGKTKIPSPVLNRLRFSK